MGGSGARLVAIGLVAFGAPERDLAVSAAQQPPSLPVAARGSIAFTNVNVLPMDTERSLVGHTVLVDAGHIVALGPDGSLRVPAGANVIDGGGRWLVPGLVDAHTHERPLPDWPDDVSGNLAMYLANGVTTIVNMGDFTGAMIGVRDRVRSGLLAGPEIYVGHFARGPSDGGSAGTVVASAAAARALVHNAHAQAYDFVKVYDGVPLVAYDALVAEARTTGLAVSGHLPSSVGLPHALGNGLAMLAHIGPLLPGAGGPGGPVDFDGAVALAQSSGTFVTATLHVYGLITAFGLDALARRDPWARVLGQEGVEYMDDAALDGWARMLQFRVDVRTATDRRAWLAQLQQQVRACDAAGVPILAGTDTIGIPGVVPGFSIHGELRLLREAGLPPWRALAAATRNPGAFLRDVLRAPASVGRVEVGARADLLLLEGDPREDADTLRRPLVVMAAGRPYTREGLWAHLDALRQGR